MTTHNTLTVEKKDGGSTQFTISTIKNLGGIMLIVKSYDRNDKFIFGMRHYPQNLNQIEKDFGKDVRDFAANILA